MLAKLLPFRLSIPCSVPVQNSGNYFYDVFSFEIANRLFLQVKLLDIELLTDFSRKVIFEFYCENRFVHDEENIGLDIRQLDEEENIYCTDVTINEFDILDKLSLIRMFVTNKEKPLNIYKYCVYFERSTM